MNLNECPFSMRLNEPFSSKVISKFSHNYNDHPLMQLDRLHDLAKYLMQKNQCRFVSPDIKQDSEFIHHDRSPDGRDLAAVFERIDEPRSWLALYNIEAKPEYKKFLDEIMSSVKSSVAEEQGDIFNVGGFIFVSAPPSVTPFHIDRENNFWLQIRGRKIITLFDHEDRDVVSGTSVENFIVNRNLDEVCLKDSFSSRGKDFEVSPGDGIFFPSTTPHMTRTTSDWVSPGDSISISIGVVFYTDYTRYQARIHQFNSLLRRAGITPRFPGGNGYRDPVKAQLGHYFAALKKRFRGYNPPPGSY